MSPLSFNSAEMPIISNNILANFVPLRVQIDNHTTADHGDDFELQDMTNAVMRAGTAAAATNESTSSGIQVKPLTTTMTPIEADTSCSSYQHNALGVWESETVPFPDFDVQESNRLLAKMHLENREERVQRVIAAAERKLEARRAQEEAAATAAGETDLEELVRTATTSSSSSYCSTAILESDMDMIHIWGVIERNRLLPTVERWLDGLVPDLDAAETERPQERVPRRAPTTFYELLVQREVELERARRAQEQATTSTTATTLAKKNTAADEKMGVWEAIKDLVESSLCCLRRRKTRTAAATPQLSLRGGFLPCLSTISEESEPEEEDRVVVFERGVENQGQRRRRGSGVVDGRDGHLFLQRIQQLPPMMMILAAGTTAATTTTATTTTRTMRTTSLRRSGAIKGRKPRGAVRITNWNWRM